MLNYVVISPLRNEEACLPLTLNSMYQQTIKPLRWILVDDGSTDNTAVLIDEAAAQFPWIVAVHRRDRGFRQAGGGVIDTFYDGWPHVADLDWDVVVKLDGDLSFDRDYFERCLLRMEQDEKLGIVGGTCSVLVDGQCRVEYQGEPSFHVRGPTKLYRRGCFEGIGGLVRAPGWDTIDQLKANMLGWKTKTFDDIPIIHHRPTGSAYGAWSNWVKNGLANFVTGYDPFFMACKCFKRLLARPNRVGLVEVCGLASGYVKGYYHRTPRVQDKALIRYIRSEQRRALFLQQSLWKQKD